MKTIKTTVQNIDWEQVNCINDVDDALCKWQELFNEARDKHAPFKLNVLRFTSLNELIMIFLHYVRIGLFLVLRLIKPMTKMIGKKLKQLEIKSII